MSESDLSGSDSENESTNRHIISKKEDTFRSLSDNEGAEQPAENIKSVSSSSDNEKDFTAKNDDDNDNDNEKYNDNDADSPLSNNDQKDSSSDESDQKPKKKGRKKKSKKDDENENSDEGEKPDKEIEELVKNASRSRSIKYRESKSADEYEGDAREILKQMANALQSDYQAYAERRFPFARLKYLSELQSRLNNRKLAKALLRDNFLNYLAAWISPYEARKGDSNTEPVYPNESFRVDILKLLLKLKLKPEYFEDGLDGKKSQIIKVLQEMPIEEGSEIAKLNTQLLNRIIRILTHADDEKVSSSLIIDKDEAAEIRRNKDSEIASYYSKSERKLDKAAMTKRKSKEVERPRDYLPPPRIISTNIKPAKRRGNNF